MKQVRPLAIVGGEVVTPTGVQRATLRIDQGVVISVDTDAPAQGDEVFDAFLPRPFRTADVFSLMGQALGLRYTFDSEDTPDRSGSLLTPALLRPLPEPLRAELHAAALRGRIDRIPEILEAVMPLDPALGARLAEAVQSFRLEEVVAALDPLQRAAHEEEAA